MDGDNFRKTHYRNPPPPPALSKQIGMRVKTEKGSDSDSETVMLPQVNTQENLEKLKTEAVQLRAKLFNLETIAVPSKDKEVKQLHEKLFNLENTVLPSKNQELEQLHQKLSSIQAEIDKANSDKNLTEDKYVDMVGKLKETKVALKVAKEENEAFSSSLEATLCDVEKAHRLEMEALETKVVEKEFTLEKEKKVTTELKLQLATAVDNHKVEIESAEKKYQEKIEALQTKLRKRNGQLEKSKKISKLKLEKAAESHKTEISSVEQQFKVEIESLKAELLERDELLATLSEIKVEKETKYSREETSSLAVSFQEKVAELAKTKEENEKLSLENSRVGAMLAQSEEDLKKSNEEKSTLQEKARKEALELTAVNLEHQREIHLLKFRLEALEKPNQPDLQAQPDAANQTMNPTEEHVQNDSDDDIEILEIVQPVRTPPTATGSNVEQPPVPNRAKRSRTKKGPKFHGIDECSSFRCICRSTFPSASPLKKHLQENGVQVGAVSKRQVGGGALNELDHVRRKRIRGFEDQTRH